MFIADVDNGRIRKVDQNGTMTTVAGIGTGYAGDGGPATSARLRNPLSVTPDATGALYIADQSNHRIRKVASNGIITTVAGNGNAGYSGDGGPATSAQLNSPASVAVDPSGVLVHCRPIQQSHPQGGSGWHHHNSSRHRRVRLFG